MDLANYKMAKLAVNSKENNKIFKDGKNSGNLVARTSFRNPLSTLCENVSLDQDVPRPKRRASVSAITSTTYNVNINLDVKVDYKNREFQTKTVQTEAVEKIPAKPTCNTATRKPAKKLTLEKKLERRYNYFKEEDLYTNCLYDTEYFSYNYQYMLTLERNYVFLKEHLMKYINSEYRAEVVNWLIYAQQILRLSEPSLFLAVRITDCFLCAPSIASKRYALIGITSLWIASKMYDTNMIFVSEICAICKEHFTKQEIISMEKEILKYVKFNLNCPDPATFLYYYLRKQKLENNVKIRFSAMFLLETLMLSLEFSSTFPSLLAASVLYFVLIKYDINPEMFLKFINSHLISRSNLTLYVEKTALYIKQILKQESVSKEVIAKYSRQNKLCVALYFIRQFATA